MGSNMAECHPVGFQWVMEAKQRGATIIHVDPRYTRTSAVADVHVPIRAGSDIAFLGGIVNHILEHDLDMREYVVRYTNAATIIDERFLDTEDLDGLFSGYDAEQRAYDGASWQYEGEPPHTDSTLQHPRCVFQLLTRHYRRYTPELVEQVCGVPRDLFLRVANTLCHASGPDRTAAFCYAVGWTQHSVGAQYIRTAAIIQLLLGNIGRSGGGILALRGHASIQGSTDIPTLYNLLPGYLPMPHADHTPSLRDYIDAASRPAGVWGHADAYIVSLLKAWWGDAATAENDFCFDYLPRISGDHSTYQTTIEMADGNVAGFFLMGENPAVGSANAKLHRRALARLDWLVVRDFSLIESATFWDDGPEIETGEATPDTIATEVFFLPAAAHTEKEGSFTNTQRLLQWHHTAVEPKGDCRSDLWFTYHLGRIIGVKLAGSTDPRDRPLLGLTWTYPVHGPHGEPAAESILREINGVGSDGRALDGFTELRADGSTACGCWIYSGAYAGEENQTARRVPGSEQSWVAPRWGWAWPNNRRLLYNRASADPDGNPWSDRKRYVWWDDDAGRWTGHDVPDFTATMRPDHRPPRDARAEDALRGDAPFVMQADGQGWLFAPSGLVDGPLPAHYEPHESPFINLLYRQSSNPVRDQYPRPADNPYHPTGDEPGAEVFPFVMTTYRVTEQHTAGAMSRTVPYLAELQPEMFCEVSPQLAAERGLEHGGFATVISARAAIEARVLVTDRMAPLVVQGRTVHQVGLPYHWGGRGLSVGDSANDLFPIVLDPNVHIQEVKAATCDIRPGRRPRGQALLDLVAGYRARAGIPSISQ
jgi:formate dehydrogenase major subunit